MKAFYNDMKLGVLGGGQLGRMLLQAGMDYNLQVRILDGDPHAPCSGLATEFMNGSLLDYNSVFNFGKDLDLITIEIEAVNADALEELERVGVKVYPQPSVIKLIQDKRLQKQFYKEHGIPTSEFVLVNNKEALIAHKDFLPAFQKLGRGGYDGKGVVKLESLADLPNGFDAPSVLERQVDIDKEISILIARSESGEISIFPPVELVYHEQNLVDYLITPAAIPLEKEKEAIQIAKSLVEELEMVGLLAVEIFVTKSGDVLVNEIAPRPHNSGHQTIEGNYTSQYAQLWRAILNLPLGDTRLRGASAMVNLLGEEFHTGIAKYEGIYDIMEIEGVYVHLYGKKITKPYRKMGHITILDEDRKGLIEKINLVKQYTRVISMK